MADLLPGAPYLDVYFDMVGALTTTGASAFKGRFRSTRRCICGSVSSPGWAGSCSG
jgi:hypothetical protein